MEPKQATENTPASARRESQEMPKRARQRLPPWIRAAVPSGEAWARVRERNRRLGLATVCEEADCPNLGECWARGAVTFMILGEVCTRGCRFCGVGTAAAGVPPDPDEPAKIAEAMAALALSGPPVRYVVLTSVDRDDLADGGAGHFARVIHALKETASGGICVEALTPDFAGKAGSLETVAAAGADVLGHNIETVERLTPRARDQRASYRGSLAVLRRYKALAPGRPVKSSLLLGLGETEGEIEQTMRDLREAGVDILTLGQYLQPSRRSLPVERYVPPDEFAALRGRGEELGFAYVTAGPLVRSSYQAEEAYRAWLARNG